VADAGEKRSFDLSLALTERLHRLVPGGAHTYAKGDDQDPADMLPILVRGKDARVWDVDGNEYFEYGMGLRSVALGHAFSPVNDAAARQMQLGSNFSRPALLELEAAEALLELVGGDMVKFAKNGSDAMNAAVRLARAFTGRDRIAMCADHPFFSTGDWFIGTTPMGAGVPQAVTDLTRPFRYNDLASLEALFDEYPGQIAAVVLEAETSTAPAPGFLESLIVRVPPRDLRVHPTRRRARRPTVPPADRRGPVVRLQIPRLLGCPRHLQGQSQFGSTARSR